MKKEYIVTAKEMKAYDNTTIEDLGIDSLILMERAALSVYERCVAKWKEVRHANGESILLVCGVGNNGGDGLCLARLLVDHDYPITTVLIGNRDKMSKECQKQFSILQKYQIPVYDQIPFMGVYPIVVDALFGVGLSRDIEGVYRDAIAYINGLKAYVIAVDIPSGICADTGKVLGIAVAANETVAIAYKKRGMVLYPGATYCGELVVADIGITNRSFQNAYPEMFSLSGNITEIFDKRVPYGNKGTFGKLLVIAGSNHMAGAAILAGLAAYKTGVGMVKLVIPEKIREIVQTSLPEALILPYEGEEAFNADELDALAEQNKWADAVLIGPGLSKSNMARKLVEFALTQMDLPLVIDADALNLVSEDTGLQNILQNQEKSGRKILLTPHVGEGARLLDISMKEAISDEVLLGVKIAEKYGVVCALKSARTFVCENQAPIFVNTAGNDRMATAGSGDVLAGITAAFLAQGMEAYDAAVNGVLLHAYAGDLAKEKAFGFGLVAEEIIAGIDAAIEE